MPCYTWITFRWEEFLLRAIQRWLDKFCYRHPGFGIPNLMLIVAIGNLLVYVLDMFSGAGASLAALLAFAPYQILHGQIWRVITFVFVPAGNNLIFLAISLYFYYMLGSALEREWGTAKFSVYYLMGMVLNIIVGFVIYFLVSPGIDPRYLSGLVTADMSYINLSLFFAFATLYPNMQVLLFFIIPLKVKWLAWVSAAIFAWSVVSNLFAGSIVGAVLPLVAILNYVLFFWSDFMALFGRVKYKTSRQTVNFKQATRQAQQQRGYIHKCAVCGKTDADYPNEEFRYCSKCNGYYCYCSQHIHNHVHVK